MKDAIKQMLEETSGKVNHKASTYSPLVLAYIGDAVYEIFVRTYLVKKGNAPVNKLHKAAKELVKAEAQSRAYSILEEILNEQEHEVLRRGRNAKSISSPKNADIMDYRRATAVEALIGYLYLEGNIERVEELIEIALSGTLSVKEKL